MWKNARSAARRDASCGNTRVTRKLALSHRAVTRPLAHALVEALWLLIEAINSTAPAKCQNVGSALLAAISRNAARALGLGNVTMIFQSSVSSSATFPDLRHIDAFLRLESTNATELHEILLPPVVARAVRVYTCVLLTSKAVRVGIPAVAEFESAILRE